MNLGSPPHEHNGQTTPDSGAISMSPGLESNEGHERQVDEEGSDERAAAAAAAAHSENGYYHGRVVRSNSKHAISECLQGDWRGARQPPMVPVKRVGFCEGPPPPIPPRQVANRSQYDMVPPHNYHTGFQRSYTMSETDMSQLTQPSMPTYISQNRMHRSQSMAHGGQMSGATFPRTQHGGGHMHQQAVVNSAFSLSSDHRLPRVHRGVHGYENIMIPPNYPMHHPAMMQGSAFMKVGNGRAAGQAGMPIDPHFMMQQMQMHHQQQMQQAGTVTPNSPSSVAPPSDGRKRSFRLKSSHAATRNSESRRASGGTSGMKRIANHKTQAGYFSSLDSCKFLLMSAHITEAYLGAYDYNFCCHGCAVSSHDFP